MLVKTRTNREVHHNRVESWHELGGTLHVVGSRKRCDPVDAIHNNRNMLKYGKLSITIKQPEERILTFVNALPSTARKFCEAHRQLQSQNRSRSLWRRLTAIMGAGQNHV